MFGDALNTYKKIKCPKCNKSHFRKKRENIGWGDFLPPLIMPDPDPIYKDGVLQNPPKLEKKC